MTPPTTASPVNEQSVEPADDGLELATGIIAVGIGVFAVAMPLLTGALVSVWLGLLLVVLGITRAEALKHRQSLDAKGVGSELLRATGYLLVGILLVVFPLEPTRLSFLLAVPLLVDGVGQLAEAVRGGSGRGYSAFVGLGLLGIVTLLAVSWPSDAAWALGLLFGLGLILTGGSLIARGMRTRRRPSLVADR